MGEIDEKTGNRIIVFKDCADFNDDGKVDELDLLRLMRFLAGEIETLAE